MDACGSHALSAGDSMRTTVPSPTVPRRQQAAHGWLLGAAALTALFFLVAGNGFLDLQRERTNLIRLLEAQGQTLLRTVQQGAENAARAADQVEALLAERLLDVARDVARHRVGIDLNNSVLIEYARRHGVHRIVVLDEKNRVVAINHSHGRDPRARHAVEIAAPILRGERRELVVGFTQGHNRARKMFGVVVTRSDAPGAVVATLTADTVYAFVSRIGLAPLLERMTSSSGIIAAAVFTGDGERLIGSGESPPTAPGHARGVVTVHDERRYRVSGAINLPHDEVGAVVLDLSLAPLHKLSREAYRHVAISLGVFALLLAVGAALWQLEMRRRDSAQTAMVEGERRALVQQLAGKVAHEVRNPLNAIGMGLQRLARRHRGDTKDAELLAILEGEVRRLDGLVEDFLDLTRAARIERVACDPAEPARSAVGLLQEEAAAAGVTITLDDRRAPASATCDPAKVTQALVNLIRNAVRVSPVDSAVTVAVEPLSGGICYRVCDRGPGIPADQRDRLFEPFVSRQQGGTGLGLPVVREIAAAHGGSIELLDRDDGGTCARLIVNPPPDGAP
jgi:signal transduction histidine kinase